MTAAASRSATAATSTPARTATSTAQDGTWQKHENGGWRNTDQPDGRTGPPIATGDPTTVRRPRQTAAADRSTVDQLNRDSQARSEGAQRTRDYGNYRGGSGTSGTGSYRGGGASRGGGGARTGGGGRRR